MLRICIRYLFSIPALILLVTLNGQVLSLKCFHCVCHKDCITHPAQERDCPTTMTTCMTQQGPGDQLVKVCVAKSGPDIGAEGQTYSYCTTDLCNSQLTQLPTSDDDYDYDYNSSPAQAPIMIVVLGIVAAGHVIITFFDR